MHSRCYSQQKRSELINRQLAKTDEVRFKNSECANLKLSRLQSNLEQQFQGQSLES
jgi:hypothetical protein